MKEKKRFNTPEEIEAAIDRVRQTATENLKQAEALDAAADALRPFANMKEDVAAKRTEASKLRRRASGSEKRIAKLSERLAVIRTPVMEAIGGGRTYRRRERSICLTA